MKGKGGCVSASCYLLRNFASYSLLVGAMYVVVCAMQSKARKRVLCPPAGIPTGCRGNTKQGGMSNKVQCECV